MARLFDDAASEYLQADIAAVTAYPLAMFAWFYTDSDSLEQGILFNGLSSSSQNYWALGADGLSSNDKVAFYCRSSASWTKCYTTTGYTVNTWHNICGIGATSTDRRAFIDGGSKGTHTTDRTPATPNRVAIGGFRDSSPNRYISGRVAEAAIWDLSNWPGANDTERANNFENIAVPALAKGFSPLFFMLGLAGYWPLVRDDDQDRVGDINLTAYNTPGVAEHPPGIIYPAPLSLSYPAPVVEAPTPILSKDGVHSLVFGGQVITG